MRKNDKMYRWCSETANSKIKQINQEEIFLLKNINTFTLKIMCVVKKDQDFTSVFYPCTKWELKVFRTHFFNLMDDHVITYPND